MNNLNSIRFLLFFYIFFLYFLNGGLTTTTSVVPSTFSGNTATDALPNHTVASSNLLRTLAPSFSSSKIVNPYSSTDLLEMFSSINRTSMIPTSAILIFTTANIVSSSEPTANISFLHSSNISGSKPILDSTVSSSVEETYFNFSKTLTTVTNITRSITASYMSTTSYTLTTSNIYTTSNMSTISVIDILSMFLSTSINSNRASITVSSGTSQYSFVSKSANAYVQSSFTDLSNSTTSYSQPTRNLNVSSVSTINTSPTMNTTLANTYSANFISISTIQSYLYFSSQNVTATDLVIMSVTTVLPLLSLSITESAIFKSSTSHSSAVYFSTPSITNKTLISSIAENTYSLVASPLYTVIIISSYTPCWVIVTYSINATTSYSPIPSTTFTPIVTWNFQNQTAIQSLFSPISTSVVNISASELIISSTESLYLATSFFSKSIYQSLVTSYSATVVAASSQIRTMYSKNISVYSNSSDSYSNSTLSVMSFTIQPTMATTNSSLKLSVMKTPSLSVLTTMSVETMRNQSVWNTSPLLPVDISTVQSNFTVPLIKDLTTIYKNNVTPIFSSPSTVVLSVFLNTTNGIKTSSSTVSNSTIYSLLHSSSDIIQIKSTLSFMSATSPITTFNNRLSTNFSSVLQTGTSFYSSIVALNLSSTTIFNFSTTTGSFTSAASVIPNVVAGTSFISSDFPQDASTTFSKLNISLFTVNTLFVNSISTKSLLFENSNLSQFNTVLSTPSFKTSSSIQRDLVNSTLTANHFSEFAITPTKAIIGTINISMTETTSINSLNLLSSNNTSLASKTSFKNSSIETVNLRTTPLLYSPSFTTFLSNVRNNSIVLDNNTSAVSQTKELILTESQSYNATTTFLSLKSASSSFSVSGNKILVRKRKDVGELNLNPTSTQPTLGFLTQLYTNVVPQSLSNFSAFNESTLSDSTLLGTELIGSSSTFVSFPFNRSSTITTSVTAIEIGSPVLPITQHLVSSTLSQCLVLYSTIVMVQSSISVSSSAVVSTTPIPQDFNVKVTLIISTVVDVNSIQFKSQLEKDLVDTYVSMSAVALRRRRRAAVNGNVTAEVTSIRRRSQYVDIKFFVKENDVKIRPVQVASVYNYLSETGLQQRLGFQVSGPVMIAVASAPYLDSDILGMVLTDISSYNLSSLTNQEDFESKMAQSYKSRRNLSSDLQVAVKVIFVKHERGNQVYIEFYFSVNDVVQNATFVASIYQDIGAPYTELTREFGVEGFKVLSVPYTANSYLFVDTRVNIIRIVLRPSVSSIDVTSAAYKANMALKLSAVYEAGKGVTIRQRRALGSVVTQIEKLQIVNNDQVEVWFIVRDAQIIQNGQNGADVMNKIDTNQMGAILNAVIITKPEPLESLPTALNTNVDYWIIAAVTAPVILLVLIMVLCCWRFKRGGPQRKTAPAPSVEQIEMVDGYKSSKLIPMDEKQVFETQLISESKKPVSSIQLASNNNIPEDEMRTSQRRKVRSVRKPHHYRRQNPQYEDDYGEDEEDEDEFKENEEEEESDEETEEEIVIVRRPVPSPKPRKEVETRRKLEYDATEDRPKKPVRLQPLEKLPVPPPLQGRSPTQLHDPSPIPLISDRRPLELTGSLMVDEELKPIPTPTLNHIAGEMPIFGRMQETRGMTTNPPLRFRTNIENNMAAYLKPTGALPILDLQQTSLVAAPAARQSTQIDPDFQHKSEVERLRNKQRQREAMFGAVPTSNDRTPPQFDKRQQDEINAVLDPDHSSINLSQRKGRLRRRLRRKNKIYMHSEPPSSKKDDILLKSYQNISTPRKQKHFDVSDSQTDETASQSASDISMREANRRIKTLIDDTFATLKKYKNNLPTDSNTGRFSSMKRGENMNSSIHRKYAGMPPSLPEPSPSHGRATTMPTGPDRHREVPPLPYMNPYQQYGPIFSEPMVTWDPLERQRYIQQRLGYPVYGPVASSLTMPYGQAPEHAVYMTPVQQRPDGIGGMVWSPYGTASDAFIGSHLKPPVPGARGDDTAPGLPVATSHSRTLDMSDIGDLKKSSSQPLIRAIKEELLKLSQSANGKTKITELQTEGAAETVTR